MMSKWDGTGYIGTSFDDYYILYSRNRNSDTITESNWRSIIKYLDKQRAHYRIERFSHWLCGWIEQILILETDKVSVDIGNDITIQLRNYPIFDDDDYSELQVDKANILLDEIMADIRDLEPGKTLHWGDHINPNMTRDEIYDVILDYGMIDQ